MADTRVHITETPRGHFFWRYSRRTKNIMSRDDRENTREYTVRNLRPCLNLATRSTITLSAPSLAFAHCDRLMTWVSWKCYRILCIRRKNRLVNFLRLRRKKLLYWNFGRYEKYIVFLCTDLLILKLKYNKY